MNIHCTVFSYKRHRMLKSLVKEIKSSCVNSYSIVDDGSDFVYRDPNFHQFEHGGKEKFWRMWDFALRQCRDIRADVYLFIPSDFSRLDFERIIDMHLQFKRDSYACNVVFDGRLACWNSVKPTDVDDDTWRVGFTDCGFFCGRSTLDKMGYYVNEINPMRFANNPGISSGVGQQITMRMNSNKIKIYMPKRSLAWHGNHPSTMHPIGRINTPLISR